ncbi:MAG: ABC transporter substrate binding protein, partial [bacterium]|nr:ABC transporter substrate binding protein [bacterium]
MELWVGAINLGFLYAFMAMGIFLTFRIFDFPDITVDGSFTTGAAVAAVALIAGWNPAFALLVAFAAGMAAGSVTALIHTRFAINGLLAGILVMTGLYSINLHIMERSNLPLLGETTFLTYFQKINPGLHPEIWIVLLLGGVMIGFWLLVSFFFKTDLGLSMRATGNNPNMTAAAGVNVNRMKILGVALANGLVGFSGGCVAQYQGFADIQMGIGTIVIGLASVIIGESVLWMRSMTAKVLSVILGAVLFRLMIAVALFVGMNPIDLKLLTAVFVLLTLVVSQKMAQGKGLLSWFRQLGTVNQLVYAGISALLIFGIVGSLVWRGSEDKVQGPRIGVVQVSDHGLLNITRDSFIAEMRNLGYRDGETCTLYVENANGELPIVNSILDKFIKDGVDIVVPISTPCAQAAINKIKDKPIVFATVANPFLINAGTDEIHHLPNVTGVYGGVPMDQTMELVKTFFPGSLRIGCMWDPSQANAVYNVGQLQEAVKAYPNTEFVGTTVTSSADVYQAAASLVEKNIGAFVLAPDNIVYSAFESIVKVATSRKIPIFMSDVERLADGAFGVLGYDYTDSGIKSAHLVDRILKGEDPKDIPFQMYTKLTIGLNSLVANSLGIAIPDSIKEKITALYDGTHEAKKPAAVTERKKVRLALVVFSDTPMILDAADALVDEIQQSEINARLDIAIERKNAQNEFPMAQSIAQDVVRLKYDYLVTLTTPVLQVCAQVNKTIPHIFGA